MEGFGVWVALRWGVGVWRVGGFGVRERESVGLEQKLVSPWTHMGGLGWVALASDLPPQVGQHTRGIHLDT